MTIDRLTEVAAHLRRVLAAGHGIEEPLLSELVTATATAAITMIEIAEARAADAADGRGIAPDARRVREAIAIGALEDALVAWGTEGAPELAPERELESAGRALAPLRHLTHRELAATLQLATAAATRSGLGVRAIAIFVAHVLPRFKGAGDAPEVAVPEHMWRTAAYLAGARPDDWRALFDASGVFERVRAGGHFDGQIYAATYRLGSTWSFDAEAPPRPLHLRSGQPSEVERRWRSLEAAARGDDVAARASRSRRS